MKSMLPLLKMPRATLVGTVLVIVPLLVIPPETVFPESTRIAAMSAMIFSELVPLFGLLGLVASTVIEPVLRMPAERFPLTCTAPP